VVAAVATAAHESPGREPPTDQSGAAQKRNRTGMENCAYGDSNADGGTKLDRSLAQHGGYPSEGFSG